MYNLEKDVQCVVHGDVFPYSACGGDIPWVISMMESRYEIKVRGVLGPEAKDDKQIRILNKCVEWSKDGITFEVDPKHSENIARERELLDKSSVVQCPGTKEKVDANTEEDEPLSQEKATRYRRLTARAKY